MHLESLKIQNFRILEDIEVKKLGHVNLIVGKNNSGKSTVLEALALLASGFEPETLQRLTNNREIGRHTLLTKKNKLQDFSLSLSSLVNKNINFSTKFKVLIGSKQNNYYIGFENDGSFFVHGEKVDGVYYYYIDDYKIFSSIQIPHLKNSLGTSTSILNYKNIFNFSYIDTHSINIEDLANEWEDIILTEAEDLALQMLRIIEPKILDLAFLTQNKQRTPYVRLANVKERTPLHSMGDGIFRLLQIILKVLKARDGFLLIDEFENGLHYSVQPEVWRLIFELAKRYNIQVFATTHSWDCIESFAKVAKEREDLEGVLFRMGRSVRKSDNGKIIATEFNEDELYNLTKDNIEVR
ncbi:AAA family ATPase [Psychrobacter sp. I-STPA10]|uniref:AAA family ATPase n=1 Tax=Psychrobacter sp. I-STPA10 TaxID=2585769 RepID=UPI001E3072A3|nr:ATP-binding protein [Psychrobacter sp. I-STPA10]